MPEFPLCHNVTNHNPQVILKIERESRIFNYFDLDLKLQKNLKIP